MNLILRIYAPFEANVHNSYYPTSPIYVVSLRISADIKCGNTFKVCLQKKNIERPRSIERAMVRHGGEAAASWGAIYNILG